MAREILVFRHVEHEDIGTIGPALSARGFEARCVDLYRDASVPDIKAAAGLIFMGGPMSANDDLPYLHQEIELIRAAVPARQPVLGVCLGAQLIAKALGARVFRNPVKEIGWLDIQFTQAASDDPLFHGLGPVETVFQWHGETFDLPLGATWLVSSPACRHQAFRVVDGVYGLQFHVEMTPEMIRDWCGHDRTCAVPELQEDISPDLHAARLAELCDQIVDRWTKLLA